jgi:hypothetical protein
MIFSRGTFDNIHIFLAEQNDLISLKSKRKKNWHPGLSRPESRVRDRQRRSGVERTPHLR